LCPNTLLQMLGLLPPQRCMVILKEFGDQPIADTRFSPATR
jgi:hypothetical protein